MFITLDEAKKYLRIDSYDEDDLITALIDSAEILCKDVARLSDDEWDAVCTEADDEANGVEASSALKRNRKLMRIAILYTVGYFFEHREEADHHDLVLTLRNILFSIREGVF